jgi:hypothetical protein
VNFIAPVAAGTERLSWGMGYGTGGTQQQQQQQQQQER